MSATLSTEGIFSRLALCRTSRTGLPPQTFVSYSVVEKNTHEISGLGAARASKRQGAQRASAETGQVGPLLLPPSGASIATAIVLASILAHRRDRLRQRLGGVRTPRRTTAAKMTRTKRRLQIVVAPIRFHRHYSAHFCLVNVWTNPGTLTWSLSSK